jgi:hypothetical protein
MHRSFDDVLTSPIRLTSPTELAPIDIVGRSLPKGFDANADANRCDTSRYEADLLFLLH